MSGQMREGGIRRQGILIFEGVIGECRPRARLEEVRAACFCRIAVRHAWSAALRPLNALWNSGM